ncbi:MAG TPA: NAD(P)H-hydrate dehydratase, partial [Candidatus Omnitrophota bacterium]|nr:NAD(P)H-hydrate dehydratase [Candidatus Omnitrophota bacterium]
MRLPTPLLRRKLNAHKNQFGHALILAGSPRMLGAAALSSLAAIRSGAGLVTLGIPKSLNEAVHKKISPTIMTLPLNETRARTLASGSFKRIKKAYASYSAIAIGPGLSQHASTRSLILKIIATCPIP